VGGDPAAIRARIEEAGREILSNPVIEDFEVRLP
jgi:phosphoribosylformylglycinamidine (FGAM) synthase PurS component